MFDEIVVATDSPEVAETVHGFGGRVELTDPSHPSGTDRVAEVSQLPRYRSYPLIVNVQGDEPFVRAGDLASAAQMVSDEGWDVGTVAAPLRTITELLDPAVVKVVRGLQGEALYFSRAPIPYPRDSGPAQADIDSGPYLRHLGLYAYAREALLRWVELPEGHLERLERLEQLRPLAAGIGIGVAIVPPGVGGVDTPDDAEWAEQQLSRRIAPTISTGVPS